MRLAAVLSHLLLGACVAASARKGEAVSIEVRPLALNPDDPSQDRVGSLRYRGGLVLSSRDRRFGGLSGLVVSADGATLTAVTDNCHWLTARLRYDAQGFLVGADGVRLSRLRGTAGEPLVRKAAGDAESFALLPDGSLLVGFEAHHRVWRYPAGSHPLAGRPEALPAPPGLEAAPSHGGLEALATLADGRVLALTEALERDGYVQGWVSEKGAGEWKPLRYALSGALRPADAATLPGGDVIVLERGFSQRTGVLVRLVRIRAESIRPGADLSGTPIGELAPPLSTDNFEGIATRRGADGATLIYLVSDDNFSAAQRTLLLMFALAE